MFVDDLVSPLRAVSVLDPAIDRAKMDVAAYAQSRDPSFVVLLPGKQARWCEVHPLTFDQVIGIESLPTPASKILQSFRWACRAVENLTSSGVAVRPTEMVRDGHRDVTTWTAAEMQLIANEAGLALVFEIGQLAYERALQGKAFGGGALFTLPQSSLDGLGRIAHQLAARVNTIDGILSSEP